MQGCAERLGMRGPALFGDAGDSLFGDVAVDPVHRGRGAVLRRLDRRRASLPRRPLQRRLPGVHGLPWRMPVVSVLPRRKRCRRAAAGMRHRSSRSSSCHTHPIPSASAAPLLNQNAPHRGLPRLLGLRFSKSTRDYCFVTYTLSLSLSLLLLSLCCGLDSLRAQSILRHCSLYSLHLI